MLGLNLNVATSSSTFNSIANNAISGVLDGGQGVGQSLSSVASGLISPYASILGVVGLGGAFQKTFGSVLANGFDVTCWGSATNPSEQKAVLEKYHLPYFNNLLSDLQNGDVKSLNRFLKEVEIGHYSAVRQRDSKKWAKCTRKAIDLHVKFFASLKLKADETVSQFINSGYTKQMVKTPTVLSINGKNIEGNNANFSVLVPQIIVTPVSVSPQVAPMIATVPKIPVNLSDLGISNVQQTLANIQEPLTKNPSFDYDGGELDNVNVNKKSPKKDDSFPWWVLLLGLGMM